ncbi:MAG TPA: hypothetical protein VFH67_02825 [bacterium]|nr:hypothetical protein [bacterium]
MLTGNRLKPAQVNHLRSNRASVNLSPDAPSTLMEMVGIVLDPQIYRAVPKASGAVQNRRPRLLIKQPAYTF